MKRRQVLKGVGTTAGAGLALSNVSVVAASSTGEKLPEKQATLATLDLGVTDRDGLPLTSVSVAQPRQNVASKNKNKVCLGGTANFDFDYGSVSKLFLTHEGAQRGDATGPEFESMPLKESYRGDSIYVYKTSGPAVSVSEFDKHHLRAQVGDADIDLKHDEETTIEYEVTLEYGSNGESQDVTVAVSVNHLGKVKVISHPEDTVIPKTGEWQGLIHGIKNGKKRKNDTRTVQYEVVEHPNGYRIVSLEGGEKE